jgi:hypothetical protein
MDRENRVRGERELPLSPTRIVSPKTPKGARTVQRWAAYLAVSAAVMQDGSYRVHLVRKDVTGARVITSLLDSGETGQPTQKWLTEHLAAAASHLLACHREYGELPY